MTTGKVTIQNETGLHARPGNEFVTFIKTLQGCKIEIENEAGKRVNASSLLKKMKLERELMLLLF